MKEKKVQQNQKGKKPAPVKPQPVRQKGIFAGESLPFSKINYILMLIGFGLTVLGYILMTGTQNIMSFRKTGLSVIVIMIGFAIVAFAIMYKPGRKTEHDNG